MDCEHRQIAGHQVIICRNGKRKRCACGAPANTLCDYPVKKGKSPRKGTCDQPMCRAHAHTMRQHGNDTIDYCGEHYGLYRVLMAREGFEV